MRSPSAGDLGPRELRLHHLPAADAQPRQHRDREHDDPHAAEPLRELPPDSERAVDLVEVGDDARARRREAGHALEVGVERVRRAGRRPRRGTGSTRTRRRAATSARRRGTPRARRRVRPRRPSGARARSPTPLVTAPATRNGQNGSPYASANGIGKSAASPRYFPSIPTRLSAGRHVDRQPPRAADPRGGLAHSHSASTTHGAFAASVKMITRSPAWSTSSPCGKIARAVPDDARR